MTCTHAEPNTWQWEDVEVSPWGDTEPRLVEVSGKSHCVDLDVGRYKCTKCGLVMYYTGHWRDYHEKGIPCSGSDGVPRVMPNTSDEGACAAGRFD